MSNAYYSQKIELIWFDLRDRPEMESYICKMCLGIYNNPVLLSCGDIFCKDCFILNNSKCKYSTIEKCQGATLHIENIPFLQSLIQNKSCHCKNNGCNEIIQIKNLFNHFNICPKEQIKCKYGCQTQDSRDKMNEHEDQCVWRKTKCEDCLEIILFKDIESHNIQCLMKMTHCILCNKEMLRKDLSVHFVDECVEYERECPYAVVNCKETLKNKDMNKHFTTNYDDHIKKYSDYLITVIFNIDTNINQYEQKNRKTNDYFNQFIGTVEQNKKSIQMNENIIFQQRVEGENKKVAIDHNNDIDVDIANPNWNNINEENDAREDENPKNTLNGIFVVNHLEERKRSRGIRKYANRKNQMEYHNILFTNNSFSTTSTVHIVNNNLLIIQSNLSQNELLHSPFHIILNNNHLYKDSSWIITPININRFFYFGVCVKEIVSNSKLQLPQELKGNHGFFGMNSDGIQYHSYSSFKNNIQVSHQLHLTQDIIFQFNKETNQLSIQFVTQDNCHGKIIIPNIAIYYSNHSIVPCVFLADKEDQIKFEFKSI